MRELLKEPEIKELNATLAEKKSFIKKVTFLYTVILNSYGEGWFVIYLSILLKVMILKGTFVAHSVT